MNDQTRAQRKQLREAALNERSLMPEPYRQHKSALLCQQLIQSFDLTLGITGRQACECTVGVYSAFPEEVQLDDFICSLYKRGAKVAFPCMISDAWSVNPDCAQIMEMRLVAEKNYHDKTVDFLVNPLKTYTHSSKELVQYPYVPASELSMLVVPVVAFDKNHNRLGYGGGTYDRYLTQFADSLQLSSNDKTSSNSEQNLCLDETRDLSCRIVGVAFEEQLVPLIPVEKHDIALPILSL